EGVKNDDVSNGAEASAEPVHEAEQVGAVEFAGIHDGEDHGNYAEDHADDQRSLGDLFDDRRGSEIEMFRRRGHFFSSVDSDFLSGRMLCKVAPEPGSRNFG